MKTGEGKTLTAVMPAYLNALTGEGVHIVTVNEYLADRDANWMGNIHKFLGLTVGVNKRDLSVKENKNSMLAIFYILRTMKLVSIIYVITWLFVRKNRVQRPLNFAIIDEVGFYFD